MAKTITRIPASVNRYTAKPIAEKTKRRVAGYARVSTEHEESAVTVRYIYKRYLEGYSTYKIACELTEMGVKTPAGKDKWHPSSVMSILQNEKYKGDALLQKTFTKDFLTHKLVVNNGEVPQYYVEGHHEGIVTADQFDQVQAEILRRKGMQKYSGVGSFSSIIRCGEYGSWYGAKVWHSNDKYRKVIYRCNNKYADGCKCKTPHINEDELKELFIKAANELFSEREEILANTKVMMEMVCETDSLDRDLQDSITELNIISEQMQIAIAENSRVALDQDEYEKRYAELTARYEKAKAKYDDIAEQIESKKAKRVLFKGFIRTLEKQDGLTCEFDAGIWSSLVQEVIVKAKDDIRFIFKRFFNYVIKKPFKFIFVQNHIVIFSHFFILLAKFHFRHFYPIFHFFCRMTVHADCSFYLFIRYLIVIFHQRPKFLPKYFFVRLCVRTNVDFKRNVFFQHSIYQFF